MKKIFTYDFGKAHCHERYVYFELEDLNLLTADISKNIMADVNSFYKGSKYVFISHRKFATAIDPEAYAHVNSKKMVGIAIVSDHVKSPEILLGEQDAYDGAFAFFPTVQEAIDWANTFD